MWPKTQFPVDLVTFTEESLKGKLHFLRSVNMNINLLIRVTGHFYAPWTYQKTICFQAYSGGIERDQWSEMS